MNVLRTAWWLVEWPLWGSIIVYNTYRLARALALLLTPTKLDDDGP